MSRRAVRWLGLHAVYTTDERTILAQLPLREQTFLHALKALTEGEIQDSPCCQTSNSNEGSLPDTQEGKPESPVYVSPDDIPFGNDAQPARTPRRRPIYALVWTWQRSKVVKTKAKGTRSMRAWKKWHERQGWKVTNHAEGYFAKSPAGELRAITLHEYDAETRERLK